ncbi:ribonuclease H1-like [Acyrthosiphon pisum]|uniref:ribonuclease H n=1 Tax=Acyrthosiphon pisum TaxID=7029 RepID=A0A8R2JRP0_ACYPI|nr:ribonuclease H1-like [Acyrthosiphon pisum]
MEILSSKQQHALIYTDASIVENRVGMAIIHGDTHIQWKLSNKCSIYTAEALAILKAIEFATNKVEANQIIILSDSLSSLMSIQNHWKPTDLARKILNAHTTASFAGKQISYMWIPGHCNIEGNELADKAAKQAHLANNPLTSPIEPP